MPTFNTTDTTKVTASLSSPVSTVERTYSSAPSVSIPYSTVTQDLAAANQNRGALFIFNNSAAPLNIRLGASASYSDFTLKLYSNGLYEIPYPVYTGLITGVWDAGGTGSAQVTEVS